MANPEKRLWAEYDPDTDVLYITLGEDSPNVETREDMYGLVWRRVSHEEIGVTVIDFKYHWSARLAELSRLIASHLRVSQAQAEAVLEDA